MTRIVWSGEFGARYEGVVGGEDGICRDGSDRWLDGLLVGGDLNKVPGRDRNVGSGETVTAEPEVGMGEAGVVETMRASKHSMVPRRAT